MGNFKFKYQAAALVLLSGIFCPGSIFSRNSEIMETAGPDKSQEAVVDTLLEATADSVQSYLAPLAKVFGKLKIDSSAVVNSRKEGRCLELYFSKQLTEYPVRDEHVAGIIGIAHHFNPGYDNIRIYSGGYGLEDLSSVFYSQSYSSNPKKYFKKAGNRFSTASSSSSAGSHPVVSNLTDPVKGESGLQGRHIALWQSHGLYFDQNMERWEWQRARIFQTVEDLYTQSYVLPFLVPMLENAGACTILPRERDCRREEVIVDNDKMFSGYSETRSDLWENAPAPGFADTKDFYIFGENPFLMGSARYTESVRKASASKPECIAKWTPSVPVSGEYAVYVSYQTMPNSSDCARYRVRHSGGTTEFSVNQKMGGGTWIYLGTFMFDSGSNSDQGVELTNVNDCRNSVVSADAVKFGGGMGNIARASLIQEGTGNIKSSDAAVNPATGVAGTVTPAVQDTSNMYRFAPYVSGYPRFTEGARYWLQWAGFNDTIYSYSGNVNDYNDDYMSRGRWVNALCGGSRVNPEAPGYGIPLDMAMAFHSDAGTVKNDSVIGTLAIYTRDSEGSSVFPDGRSRTVSRELADLIQTQIVNDVRAGFNPEWTRRGLWDRSYAESRIPHVPVMLLELLSHQNFTDMIYGLDPEFRFTVSRAIYKGILKYFSLYDGSDYVVQPLPVNSFSVTRKDIDGVCMAHLEWKPTADSLEATAMPSGYRVYTKVRNLAGRSDGKGFVESGWDNGIDVSSEYADIPVEPGRIYSFKVVAVNDGGRSFPSETLSMGVVSDDAPTVMVVNGFTRVSAPAFFGLGDTLRAGFDCMTDHGVPYLKDISFIGSQYEFRRSIPWLSDDSPGHGGSYSDYEDKVVAGNTFDYPAIHGAAFMKAGLNFVSSSRAAIENSAGSLLSYPFVDIIFGKQAECYAGKNQDGTHKFKHGVFTDSLQARIREYCSSDLPNGGTGSSVSNSRKLLISGSYVGSDLWDNRLLCDAGTDCQHGSNADGTTFDIRTEGQKFAAEVLKFKWHTHNATRSGSVEMIPWATVVPDNSISGLRHTPAAPQHQAPAPQAPVPQTLVPQPPVPQAPAPQHVPKATRHTPDTPHSLTPQQAHEAIQKMPKAPQHGTVPRQGHDAPLPHRISGPENPQGHMRFSWDTKPNGRIYNVETPDGIVPACKEAKILFRYTGNGIPAGIGYKSEFYDTVILGFPVEVLRSDREIEEMISKIVEFFVTSYPQVQ